MTSFGERLKLLADKLGKDDQDVANDLGLSKAQMSHYTTGKRKVPSELLQKIITIYGVNPAFLFREDAPLFIENTIKVEEENNEKYVNVLREESALYGLDSFYPYYPVNVAAGQPTTVDYVTENNVKSIAIPNIIMGKWAGSKEIFLTKINGESMNRIIPNNSIVAVKEVTIEQLKDNDIIIFSHDHEYSVKRFWNDKEHERFIFRPDSNDSRFIDYVIPYSESRELKIHGKVVMYIVEQP